MPAAKAAINSALAGSKSGGRRLDFPKESRFSKSTLRTFKESQNAVDAISENHRISEKQ